MNRMFTWQGGPVDGYAVADLNWMPAAVSAGFVAPAAVTSFARNRLVLMFRNSIRPASKRSQT